MSDQLIVERLDQSIAALLAGEPGIPGGDAAINHLLQVAGDLRYLPRPEFKARLRAELDTAQVAVRPQRPRETTVMPTLVNAGQSTYPVRGVNFVASLALHAAAAGVLLTSSMYVVKQVTAPKPRVTAVVLTDIGVYEPSPQSVRNQGGGGGGDRDKLHASFGGVPETAAHQITPPAVLVRNEDPALAGPPTVVVPDNVRLPQLGKLGDPLTGVTGPPSNGTGSGAGIGSGTGGGIGSGRGVGVGPGTGGSYGGGVFRVGGRVSAPRAIHAPDPEYSDEARKAKYQGVVVLWVIVGTDGKPRDVRVSRSLGMGLDEQAVAAVRQWRFDPAKKDGQPVAVQINVEVNFRLY